MDYYSTYKESFYGLGRVYETVIDGNPSYAYLLEGNNPNIQRMVMCHVYGHCHVFKNNMWHNDVARDLINVMANHANIISKYIDKYGEEKIEEFIDICLCIDNLIDAHGLCIKRKKEEEIKLTDDGPELIKVGKIDAKFYMDKYINPPEELKKKREKVLAE